MKKREKSLFFFKKEKREKWEGGGDREDGEHLEEVYLYIDTNKDTCKETYKEKEDGEHLEEETSVLV